MTSSHADLSVDQAAKAHQKEIHISLWKIFHVMLSGLAETVRLNHA
jgi:hypothetical protein